MKIIKNFVVVLIPIFLLISLDNSGQNILPSDTQGIQNNQDTAAVLIQPIAIAEIASATVDALNQISRSGQQRLSEEEIYSIVEQSDTLFFEIDVFLNDSSLWIFEGISTRELEKLENRSAIYLNHLADIQTRFSKHSERSEIVIEELLKTQKRWQYTLEDSTESAIPEVLHGRIINTINSLDSVRTELQGDIEIILLQLDKLADIKIKLQSMQDLTSAENRLEAKKLITKDRPALFRELASLKDSTLVQKHLLGISESVKSDLQLLTVQHRIYLIVVIVIFVLLLILSIWFKNNYSRMISSKLFVLTDLHLKIIGTPVPVVILVTTFMIRIIFPDLPLTFRVLNTVISIISILIIADHIFDHVGKSLIRWLTVLLLFSVAYEFIIYPDILQRIILLSLSITSFGLFLWDIIKRPAKGEFKNKFIYNFFRTLLAGFMILLLASIIGNLLGLVKMAEFYTLATTEIVFLALAIKIGTMIADTIIFLLLASKNFQRVNVIREEFPVIYKKSIRLINLSLWIFFTVVVLTILRIKEPIFKWGNELLTNGRKIGAVDVSLKNLLLFFFIIWLSVVISKALRHILEKDVFTRVDTAKGMPTTINMIIQIVLITGGFFLAVAAAGMELTNISIIIGAFSVGIGFGLQNIFNNMVSGLILAFERPLKVGDMVQVDELMGVVLSIGFRSSTIHRVDGAEVIVPNGNLVSNQMINWTLSDSMRRMDLRVGVAYGTDPEIVIDLMQKVAKANDRVMEKPDPKAYFTDFGDSSLNFRLLAWTEMDYRLAVESELNIAFNSELKALGIEIPFPQQDLHIKSDFREKPIKKL